MHNIYKIIILLLSFMIIVSVNAKSIDFYWEKDVLWDISKNYNIENINKQLDDFYMKTWLNTDFVIIWKNDSCYLRTNYAWCIREREKYNSDLIVILSMKSDIKNRWNIESLIKDNFKETITPLELNIIEESIVSYFKREDYKWWLSTYLRKLEDLILNKCNEIWINDSCNATILAKQYHLYIAEQESIAKKSAFLKVLYYIFWVILIILSYVWLRKFYIYSLNNLYKDVKYKIKSLWEYELFKKDRGNILSSLEWLEKNIKLKLWDLDKNAFLIISFYRKQKNHFIEINSKLNKMQKNFINREELKDKIDNFKSVDL